MSFLREPSARRIWPILALSAGLALPGLFLIAAVVAAPAMAVADSVMGTAPTYTDKAISAVPNAGAVLRRIWAPGLDDGFVAQGLTMVRGKLLMVGYLSAEANPDRGPSRVFQVDPATGALTGRFDLPADLGHPGGLAYGDNALYVADHAKLLRLDLSLSLAKGQAAVTGRRTVDPAMGPSFLAWHDKQLWFGRWTRPNQGQPWLYAVPTARIFNGAAAPLRPADASRRVMLPLLVQGATFDARGHLWLTASTQRFGRLYRVDPADGRVIAEYAVPAGIEDLAHAPDGRLWSVGESGSKRWLGSATFYPLIFELEPGRLVPERR